MSRDKKVDKKSAKKAGEPIQEHLEESLADIDEPEKAAAVVDKLVQEVDDEPAIEAAAKEKPSSLKGAPPDLQAKTAARRVEQAAATETDEVDEAVATIKTAAEEATLLEGPAYEAVAEKLQKVTAPELYNEPEKLEEPRRHLRDAILHHSGVSLLDKLDAQLFILINTNVPHTPAINTFFYQLSLWFTSGWAWLLGLAAFWPFRREWAANLIKKVAAPMWVAGAIVEGPVKLFFRRRRPFIDIVRTVVVGKKPGNWSFPSGHSATAFAGAWMLSKFLPRWRWLWYFIAALVGFSRIFVGAHYPGDVVSGSLFGMGLAELTHRLLSRLWGKSKR
jgi:membrane-associated phospholipid phosphatase